jgi:TRAP-type mannitol/chloroaromatic compound transport system permease large subunit
LLKVSSVSALSPLTVKAEVMIDILANNLAPVMFLTLVVMLLLGYPVAFTLAANGLVFFFLAVELSPFALETISLNWNLLNALPERVFAVMSNEVLLAIPFFTFMGIVLQKSGMAEDLLETFGQFFGAVPGGVAYAVILVGTLLAATTGVVAASVITMGLISLPVMMRYGYDRRVASGTIMASGTLAQILPPSTILIVLADQLGTSVGDMYTVAFLPSLFLTLSFIVYILMLSFLRPAWVPALPAEAIRYYEPNGTRGIWQVGLLFISCGLVVAMAARATGIERTVDVVVTTTCGLALLALFISFLARITSRFKITFCIVLGGGTAFLAHRQNADLSSILWLIVFVFGYVALDSSFNRLFGVRFISQMATKIAFVLVPPVLLIFMVLGTIFIGLATPIEAGAMGAVGTVLLAVAKRFAEKRPDRLDVRLLTEATYTTARLSTFILFILIGARVFALTFFGINGHIWVEQLLVTLPGGHTGFLLFTVVVIFVLGCFLDFFEIAFIAIPLLLIPATTLGIDPLWLGLLIAVTLQTSFLTPPLGFSLFFLRSVAPDSAYRDEVTGSKIDGISTRQIYLGGLPFIIIQLVLIILLLTVPELFLTLGQPEPLMSEIEALQELDNLIIEVKPELNIIVPAFDHMLLNND